MSQLEKVFLANVILYLDSISTAIDFVMINHKCADALQIIKINPLYVEKEENSVIRNYTQNKQKDLVRLQKIAKLFSNLQTFVIPQEYSSLIPEGVDNVILQDVTQEIDFSLKDKVVEISGFLSFDLDLFDYPRLRRIDINDFTIDLEKLFSNTTRHINQVVIHLFQKNESALSSKFFEQIKKYNIGTLILYFHSINLYTQLKQKIPNIFYLARCCVFELCPDVISNEVILVSSDNLFVINELCNEQILKTYFISKATTSSNSALLDFSKITSIQELFLQRNPNQFILPSTLTKLLYFGNGTISHCAQLKSLNQTSGPLELVPSTLTEMVLFGVKLGDIPKINQLKDIKITNYENYSNNFGHRDAVDKLHKKELSINFSVCEHLTSLEIEKVCFSHSIQCLSNLRKLIMTECLINHPLGQFYPSNIEVLKCRSSQIPPIECTKHLKSLCLACFHEKEEIDISQITSLKEVKLRSVHKSIKLPQIETLEINATSESYDLSYLLSLKELILDKSHENTITLPPGIKTIIINQSSTNFPNASSVEPKVYLNSSRTRISEFKSVFTF